MSIDTPARVATVQIGRPGSQVDRHLGILGSLILGLDGPQILRGHARVLAVFKEASFILL